MEREFNARDAIKDIEVNSDHINRYHPYGVSYGSNIGTMDYLNLCMKAVSRHGPSLQNIPEKYRTKQICIAAVLSCKAEDRDLDYALKYVPEKFHEECRLLYQYSSNNFGREKSEFGEKIEDFVRERMKEDFQDARKRTECFEKVKVHINNLDEFAQSLDKLYTIMREIQDVKENSSRWRYDNDKEENDKNKFREIRLFQKSKDLIKELYTKLSDLEISETDYFEAAHLCNSEKNLDSSRRYCINAGGELLYTPQNSFSRNRLESFTDALDDISKQIKNNESIGLSIKYIESLANGVKNNQNIFCANIDYVLGRYDDYDSKIEKDITKYKWDMYKYDGGKDKATFDYKYSREIDREIKNEYENISVIIQKFKLEFESELEKRKKILEDILSDENSESLASEHIYDLIGTWKSVNSLIDRKNEYDLESFFERFNYYKEKVNKYFCYLDEDIKKYEELKTKGQDEGNLESELTENKKDGISITENVEDSGEKSENITQSIENENKQFNQVFDSSTESVESDSSLQNNIKIESENGLDENSVENLKSDETKDEANMKNSLADVKTEKKSKEQTLRQKFDISIEEGFNKLLETYASYNVEYYDGHKRTKEEINKRKKFNAQFKRIIDKKVKDITESEKSSDSNFAEKMEQISTGGLFSDKELEEVAKNKGASLKLFQIMASGIYEKDGEKIRLTQKQRVALASTLQKVSEIMLGNETNKKLNGTKIVAEKNNIIESVKE